MEYQYSLLDFHEEQERLTCLLLGKKFKRHPKYVPPWMRLGLSMKKYWSIGRAVYNGETKEWDFVLHKEDKKYLLPHEQPKQWPMFVEKLIRVSFHTDEYLRENLKYYFEYSKRI